ncbi:hypothetical protein DM01DRAFT_1405893 [Hesseltinella vesiculosa]|uniref:Kinetochore protein Sos7 coiled-coil domain-containing protein n=1 Tax=Hesseltinella vesiculosa TaxID=101127 RepID=A0A1X2GPC0_9FUNG|nr:hypothetical protein DM01DRAFT_1405893 [Hesseltinella vesiculosa]
MSQLDTNLVSQVSQDLAKLKSSPLHLLAWHHDYGRQLGLLEGSPASDDAIDLPLHPVGLQQELIRYKGYLDRLKNNYIQLESRRQLAHIILQDPPKYPTKQDLEQLERDNFVLKEQLYEVDSRLKQMKSKLEYSITSLAQEYTLTRSRVEDFSNILEEIERMTNEQQRIEGFFDQLQKTRTEDEIRAMLNEQKAELEEATKVLDSHNDVISSEEFSIYEHESDVQALETKLKHLQSRAKQAIDRSASKDLKVEERGLWYIHTTKDCYTTFGIHNVTRDFDHEIIVDYTSGDKLTFTLDPLTKLIASIHVDNPRLKIADLQSVAKDHTMDDTGATVMLEVLARIKSVKAAAS